MTTERQDIADRIRQIARVYPRRVAKTGQLYTRKTDLKRTSRKIVLWAVFASNENTFLLRDHEFKSKRARGPAMWHSYLTINYPTILNKAILPGISQRTAGEHGIKFWRLHRILGWHLESARATVQARHSRLDRKRRKTKPSRRARG